MCSPHGDAYYTAVCAKGKVAWKAFSDNACLAEVAASGSGCVPVGPGLYATATCTARVASMGHARALAPAVTIVQVISYGDTTCVSSSTGAVFCWGAGGNGQLGTNMTADVVAPEAPIPLSVPVSAPPFFGIGLGEQHICVALVSGTARCWGKNDAGQLGYGDLLNRYTPPTQDILIAGTISQIVAGFHHTCALLTTSRVRCFGSNENGQLGYGDNISRPLPPSLDVPNLSGVTQVCPHVCPHVLYVCVRERGGGGVE